VRHCALRSIPEESNEHGVRDVLMNITALAGTSGRLEIRRVQHVYKN
jgi:hypothetical protein